LVKRIAKGNAQKYAAESALAEATALLENMNQGNDWYQRRDAFLSRTPAPAATVTHLECQLCGDPLDDEHPKGPCVPCHELPAPAAKAEPTLAEAQPGKLTNNAGLRAAKAEALLERIEAELAAKEDSYPSELRAACKRALALIRASKAGGA
jgi:hypothetical protein